MKKRYGIFMLVFICTIFFHGCENISVNAGEKVKMPFNTRLSIKGTWRADKLLASNSQLPANSAAGKWLNKPIEFDESYVIMGEDIFTNPRYKIKNVDAGYYCFYTYKIKASKLDISDRRVDVISVSSGTEVFYEFVIVDATHMTAYLSDGFYNLVRISEKTSGKAAIDESGEEKSSSNYLNMNKLQLRQSGILLGLCNTDQARIDEGSQNSNSLAGSAYRTLWISAINRRPEPVMEMPGLLVPRQTGFWKVGIDRFWDGERIRETLFAYDANNLLNQGKITNKSARLSDGSLRKILFVGNDYMAVEYSDPTNSNKMPHRLQILPLDNIGNRSGVKISEILGEEGKQALVNSAQAFLETQNTANNGKWELSPNEDSIAIERINGHWMLKGRLYALLKGRDEGFADFNISIIPPEKMIRYDSLKVPWNAVKAKRPDAVDAYTSPNNDIAVIVCKNALYTYSIAGGLLSEKPLDKVILHKSEKVVMAEWGLGEFVELWKRRFQRELDMLKK